MTRDRRHLLGAFAAMIFVGASWGGNLPVTKVMLRYYDLIPMAALRTMAATASLILLLWMIEGGRALRVDVGLGRFLLLPFRFPQCVLYIPMFASLDGIRPFLVECTYERQA